MDNDYYDILGVNINSSSQEIKKAFRKMSLENHPDRNNNDSEKTKLFKKITQAYEILSDESKRKDYDLNIKSCNFNDIVKNELFSSLFKNFNNLNTFDHFYQNIPIIDKYIELTLEQSYTGVCLPIIVDKWRLENNNKIMLKETLYVDLFPGIDNGEIIFFKNKGNYINKDLIGDIQVMIKIKNHNLFYRNGLDLYFDKNITFKEAFCGFSFDLLFLNGKEYKINNKEGNIISPGYQKILENFGMKRNDKIGSLLIKFNIEFPHTVNDEQIKFINDFF